MACIYPDGDTKCYWASVSKSDKIEIIEPEMSKNADLAPMEGRVGINTEAGTIGYDAFSCPLPGLIRLVLKSKNPGGAKSAAMNEGCFSFTKGDHVKIVDRMPKNDEPASHLCVKFNPAAPNCTWILNVGVTPD